VKRRALAAIVLAALCALGLAGGVYATHTVEVEELVLPWTLILGGETVTGEVTVTDTDQLPHETVTETTTQTVTETSTVTVTEPPPTITEPPPTTTEPPPSALACSVDNRVDWGPIYDEGDCEFGATINRTNQLWFCNAPLSSYGPLPIRVVQTWSIAAPVGQNGIELRTGCSGDGTPAIDLIVEQHLLGIGRISDPFKTRMVPGPQNVDVTGFLNASGPQAVPLDGDHQDCIQLQGGAGNNFVNIDGCGDYAAGESNTQAAGGTVFFSLNDSQANILGGQYIGCNHSLYPHPNEVGPGMNASHVIDAKFRSGKLDAYWCAAGNFNASNPCAGAISQLAEMTNVTCQRWINGAWQDVAP
jgi:hypothetical protein